MKHLFYLLILIVSCQSSSQHPVEDKARQVYSVGTQFFKWTDTTRQDPYYGGNRIINAQIWYPIDSVSTDQPFLPAPYYPDIEKVWKKLEGWSQEDVDFVAEIPTHSLVNVPIKNREESFPLLLFSPSLGGHTSLYTYYAEVLAAKGYVVMGVNHLYESEYVINENGDVFPQNHTFHDSLEQLTIPDQLTGDEFRATKSKRTKVLGEDLIYSLNRLAQINRSIFKDQIDLDRLGVWGHSIGGAAAIYAGILDKRFKAVVDLDGTPPSEGLQHGITQPFLFIEDLTDYKNHDGYHIQYERRSDFCKKGRADATRILIGGISHRSFIDINYHTASSLVEKRQAENVLALTTAYMIGFFKGALNGVSYSFEAMQSDSLEVIRFKK